MGFQEHLDNLDPKEGKEMTVELEGLGHKVMTTCLSDKYHSFKLVFYEAK